MNFARVVCVAAIAFSVTGLGSFLDTGSVRAGTVNISGVTPPFPGYGNSSGNNNVIDSGLSGVTSNSLLGSSFKGSASGSPAFVTTDLPVYNVDWYFVGSESGFTNTLVAPGINPLGALLNSSTPGEFNESNQNNNCSGCGHGPNSGPVFLGTSTGQTSSVLNFSLRDNQGSNIANGSGNPNAGAPSIIFSFVTNPDTLSWVLSTDATSSWFLFGFNDKGGGPDLDFDDFVGVARVYCGTPNGAECASQVATPIPAALPLFASGLGALGLFAWRKKRKRSHSLPMLVV